MAAPSITDPTPTTINFIALDGVIDPMSEQLEIITRTAQDGVAFRKMGQRGRPFIIEAMLDLPAGTTNEAQMVTFKALCGQLCTIVDNIGDSYENVMIMDVQPLDSRNITGPTGGVQGASGVRLLTVRFICHVTTVPS